MTGPNEPDANGGHRPDPKLIFISYASPDRASAESLVREIEAIGIRCWIAPRDIPAGANYAKAILDAIEAAKVFVVLLSASANEETYVAKEVECAANYRNPKKMMVPLRLENIKPCREIQLHIAGLHWVDLFEGPQREQNMRGFLDVLRDVLRAWLLLPPPPPPPPPGPEPAPSSPPDHEEPPAMVVPPGDPSIDAAVSNPELRDAILNELQKSGASRSGFTLYRVYGVALIPELCLMLRENSRGDICQLLLFCGVQPTARAWTNPILDTMIERMERGSENELLSALPVIKALPIPRAEKWRRLFNSFALVHSMYGHALLDALIETVPPDKRDDLCRELIVLIHVPNSRLQGTAIDGIRKFGYQAAASELRELVATTSDSGVALKAAQCLTEWHDTACGSSIRSAITACNDGMHWCWLADCLCKIEGPHVGDFLIEQFLNLVEGQQTYVLSYGFWNGLKALNPKSLAGALERIAIGAADPKLRELARNRLSELAAS